MTRRAEWGVLGALVLASAGLRAWAALAVPGPWIAPDEMVYGLLGRGLFENGSLDILGGPTPYYSFLTPLFAGLPLSVLDLGTGYDLLQGLQALAMSAAAVPVYLWGRSLVSRRWALVAATLTVAAPGLTYSGLIMTEVLFYPLLVLAAWATAESIARPTVRTQVLLVLAVTAASATRLQAIVLLPAFLTAALVDAAIARSWANLRRLVPAAAGLATLLLAWIGWRLVSGSGTLGGYEVVASTSYSVGDAARFVVYHLSSVLILCGLFPAAAVALLVLRARHGEPNSHVRAYLAVAVSLTAWLVVEVGVFASHYSDRIVERNLIGLAPVLFLGLVLWIERGTPGGYVERAAIAAAGAAVLLVLPVRRYANAFGTHDAMTMIPMYRLAQMTSQDTLLAVYAAFAGAAAVAFALLPRRALRGVPLLLLAALVGASVVSARFVAREARAEQHAFLGSDPRWIDHSADGPAVYLYDGEPSWNGVWQTVFWNERADRVYDLGPARVPGPLPQSTAEVQADGTVFVPPGAKQPPDYAVVSTWTELVGSRAARVDQQGLSQAGLALWKIAPPLRMSSRISGLQVNGDVYAHTEGRLEAFGCGRGTFHVTLLIKQAQTVDLRLDGKVVQHLDFPSPKPDEPWHGDIPVTGRGGKCTLVLAPSGLIGTTVFSFERG